MTDYRTRCCNAPFGVGGEGTTHWYLCTACGQPTHPLEDDPMTEEESDALLLCSEHGVGIGDSDVPANTSLLKRVHSCIVGEPECGHMQARSVIREVAAWLRENSGGTRAAWMLEQQIQ